MTRRGRIGRHGTFGCEAIKRAREADALTGDGSVKRATRRAKKTRKTSQSTHSCLSPVLPRKLRAEQPRRAVGSRRKVTASLKGRVQRSN